MRIGIAAASWASAAAVWAFAFAALSAYWAAGGSAGVGALADGLAAEAAAREPGFVALLWVTAAGKALLGLLALALGRSQPPRARRLLRAAGTTAGAALALYGAANLLDFALMAAGARDVPAAVGDHALVWYLLLWEPLWILGGALLLAAARTAPAAARTARDAAPTPTTTSPPYPPAR